MDIIKLAKRYDKWLARLRKHSYIELTDNNKLVIDFVRGVDIYEKEIIKLRIAKNVCTVIGAELRMSSFTSESVIIRGKITSVNFEPLKFI